MAVFIRRTNGARRRARGHRRRERLALLFVLGALVAAACTQRSDAGADLETSAAISPASAAHTSDIVAPTPIRPNPTRSPEEACRGGAIVGSNGSVSCGGNIGFRGLSPAYALAIQADGKIVAVGGTGMYTGGGYDNNFALARYNPDGSADQTFGDGGRVATQLEFFQEAHGVAIQNDEGIVVAGSPSYGGAGTVSLARYRSDGTPDPSFSENGWVDLPWVGRAFAVAVQPDGKILSLGAGAVQGIVLARYLPNGDLDPAFGSDGLVTSSPDPGSSTAYSLGIQPDGRIVVAGRSAGAVLLARFQADGTADRTFGSNGLVTARFARGPNIAFGLVIQPDGGIVVTGRAGDALLLARFEPNGSLDGTFGRGGGTITDLTTRADIGRGVALQANGRIVVAGGMGMVFEKGGLPRIGASVVIRYQHDGALDASFGRHGLSTTAFGERVGIANSVAIGASERIVVVGLAGRREKSFGFAEFGSE